MKFPKMCMGPNSFAQEDAEDAERFGGSVTAPAAAGSCGRGFIPPLVRPTQTRPIQELRASRDSFELERVLRPVSFCPINQARQRHGMARILLIEDDDFLRGVLHDVLAHEGHRVVTARHGRHGIRQILPGSFDLLITDIVMPDADGLEVLREARIRDPRLKILAISGGGNFGHSETYLRLASQLGANRILAKPFSREQLLAVIIDLLRAG
jgi:CheY-like chemotaxis protein